MDQQRYLDGERGPWTNGETREECRWLLSNRENIHRMRCKLIANDEFNEHLDSSRLRDNLHVDPVDPTLDENRREEQSHGNTTDELKSANERRSFLIEKTDKM